MGCTLIFIYLEKVQKKTLRKTIMTSVKSFVVDSFFIAISNANSSESLCFNIAIRL